MNLKSTASGAEFRRPKRIAIVGCSNVAPASVYSLGHCGAVDEIVLVGEGQHRLFAGIERLISEFPLEHPFQIAFGTYDYLDKADIVLLAVGVRHSANKKFSGRLAANARLVRLAMEQLRAVGFGGIVLVMTNPVDEMTQLAQEISGFAAERVIGVGGISASVAAADRNARKRTQGGATWCSAHHSGGQLMDTCQPDCPYFESVLAEFNETKSQNTRRGEYQELASCVMNVCEAILRDEPTVVNVSVRPSGEYGIWGVHMTFPCVVSGSGVERILELKSGGKDREPILAEYARELKATNQNLKGLGFVRRTSIA